MYNSLHRETIERYLYKVSFDFMLKFIDHVSSDLIVDESDKNFIAAFYKFALVGIILDWLEGGMKTEPDELISRLSKILSGTLRTALLNADKSGKSNS